MSQKARLSEGRVRFILVVFTALVFVVVAIASNLEKALAISVAFGAIATVVSVKLENGAGKTFWVVVSIFIAVHVVALTMIEFPQPRFGLIALPFGVIDALIMWGILNWTEKRFPGRRDPDQL